jgi:hypothetical protein
MDFFGSKNNIGNITSNCVFVNQNEQEHETCWLHALASTVAMVENPHLFEKMSANAAKISASKVETEIFNEP